MRNVHVQEAVELLIEQIDLLSEGLALGKPTSRKLKQIFDDHIQGHGGSVILACAFLSAYSLTDPDWDYNSVPTGTRGKYGDKALAGALTFRHVTLHRSVTAFGENLGWKGNVRNFHLSSDARFSGFLQNIKGLSAEERRSLVNHIAFRLHESRVVPKALPKLPSSYLSYARSLALCETLLAIPSEGHIQQFLVASFLEVHRRRLGNRVVTHHPHASDKFDGTTGDIEEFRDYELVAAYEVTVRDDWKNRLADFGSKVADAKLPKYIIFASNVRSDPELYPASNLVNFVERLHFDLAIVDLLDFFSVFCAEFQREEIEQVINRTYELLCDPRLCGRADFIAKFRDATDRWLES
jgi:hypothetical protein